jgi:uncharacterized integral membrane protein
MRFLLNTGIFFIIIICATFLSFNSQIVEIRFLPKGLTTNDFMLQIPIFILMLGFTFIGLFIGTLTEYLRSSKIRKLVQKKSNQVEDLNTQVNYLRTKSKSETDEILSLLK